MKRPSPIFICLLFVAAFSFALAGCDGESANATSATSAPAGPLTETDLMISGYEKAAKDYLKVAKRFKGGDVSVTVRYIDLGRAAREREAKLRAMSATLTPTQAHRVAAISATTAPYAQK